jgi:hypothetical protein
MSVKIHADLEEMVTNRMIRARAVSLALWRFSSCRASNNVLQRQFQPQSPLCFEPMSQPLTHCTSPHSSERPSTTPFAGLQTVAQHEHWMQMRKEAQRMQSPHSLMLVDLSEDLNWRDGFCLHAR